MLLPAIVLIEKDEVTLDIYQRELCKSFRVFSFMDISDVADTLSNEDIQAIIIEPELCGGQGWEWITSIRELVLRKNIPIIVCSTQDFSPNKSEHDFDTYLTKPVLPRTLHKKILDVLSERKMKRGQHE